MSVLHDVFLLILSILQREDYGEVSQEDFEDKEDELPTVVVLKRGDLTAEEAKIEEDRLQKGKNNFSL